MKLPQDIGPHEGREFDLMRAGQKDVAYFCELEPNGLDAMVASGFCLLKYRKFTHQDKAYFSWIVFREGFEHEALRLKDLTSSSGQGFDPEREHDIGRILSYTPQQVDAFLRHVGVDVKQ